jgi:metal-responsive CopG/Arc/MetJ family transcriptional regulator
MVIVNISVPKEIKDAFDEMFGGKNKDAIISDLMMHAVEKEKTRRKRVPAIDA